jgi:UDP-glucuronate decarboxylase
MQMATDGRPRRVLVAGAAGFIGSHLCDALISRGMAVTGIDSFLTGRPQNIAHLRNNPRFTFLHLDIIDPLPLSVRADLVFNLACAASPPQYQADPVHTMLSNVLGTRNLLALAADCGARFVLASTSEVYGDPLVHPQTEGYWGVRATTKASVLPRRWPSITSGPAGRMSRSRASSTPTDRACAPTTDA